MKLHAKKSKTLFYTMLLAFFFSMISGWPVEGKSLKIAESPAPKEFSPSQNQPSGNIEIQVFGPDYIKPDSPPAMLIKGTSNFDIEKSDIELANNPLPIVAPVRIKGFKPGKYYVGVRVPPKINTGSQGIPIPQIEDFAWDGVIFESYRINSDASGMFAQRWYEVEVESEKTSVLSAIFLSPSKDINKILFDAANHPSIYKVNMNPKESDEAFGIKRSMLPDLLSKTGKVFIPEGFVPRTDGYDSIWYLPDASSGVVKAAGKRKDQSREASGQDSGLHFATANSAISKKDHRFEAPKAEEANNNRQVDQNSKNLPSFVSELQGRNEVRVKNPNNFKVAVGIRSGNRGKNFEVASNGVSSVYIPDGRYDIYFVYSNKPDALFKGDNFALNNNGIEIQIVKVVGGNYGINRVK